MTTLIWITAGCLWLLLMIGEVLYFKKGFGKKLYHNKLGWHRPNNEIKAVGINYKSTCKYCGKEIIQDSQGNWF